MPQQPVRPPPRFAPQPAAPRHQPPPTRFAPPPAALRKTAVPAPMAPRRAPPPAHFEPAPAALPKTAARPPGPPRHEPPPTRFGQGAAKPAPRHNSQSRAAQPYLPLAVGAVAGIAGGLVAGPVGTWLGYEVGAGVATTIGLVTAGLTTLAGSALLGGSGNESGNTVPLTQRTFTEDPSAHGGSYGQMKKLSKRNVREADHIPPKSTYVGKYYGSWKEDDMPAVSIAYETHRKGQSGGGGGVSTTGSSGIASTFRDSEIEVHMRNGQFYKAMIAAINDQKNAAKNTLELAQGQKEAAEYARSVGLLKDDLELAAVLEAVNRITY